MSPARVLVTGASSGIGLATAKRFARPGATVAVLAREDAGLEAAARAVRERGARAVRVRADVTDRDALASALARCAAELGGFDVVVVNVGSATFGRFVDTAPPDFDRVIQTTLLGNVDTIREVLPHLAASRGTLVVVGSAAADLPLPLMSSYTAAKHAIRGFVDALRIELRADEVPVAISLVEPGPVDTPFWGNVASQAGRRPPVVPFSYHPREVAAAIDRSVSSRQARVTVGGTMVVARAVHRLARPLTERVLARLVLVADRATKDDEGAAAIWNPGGAGRETAGRVARPSVLVRTRQAGAAGSRRFRRLRHGEPASRVR